MFHIKRKLICQDSHIHGKGLFTTVAIPRHAIIGKCQVRKTTEPNEHTLWIEGDKLKMVDVICKLKYINHSKKPNVAYLNDLDVVALRHIRAGEELTHDYGDAWE
jgi:hypothetical protein